MVQLTVLAERFPINGKFTIARGAKTEAVVVTVLLEEQTSRGPVRGRGECVPYTRYQESVESVVALIESVRKEVERGLSREALQSLLPAGAARNALDSAYWDLEAKRSRTPAAVTAGVGVLHAVTTAFTISLGSVEEMREATLIASDRPILKIKLGAPGGDLERIRAVREAAPRAQLIADANEGWTEENIEEHLAACAAARFSLIEQPLPQAKDEALRAVRQKVGARTVPLCADESVHDRAGLDRLVGLYDVVNIKLDKTGGLTEALKLAEAATARGFGIMIGCMVGTSLAMAPALTLAMRASFVDLDGPLLLAQDREGGLKYDGSVVHPPSPALWG